MGEILRIGRVMQRVGRAAQISLSAPCGRVREPVQDMHELPGAKNQVLDANGWNILGRLAGERAFSSQPPPTSSNFSTKEQTVQVNVGPEKVRYMAGAMAQQVINDLTSRYGAGRLSTADGVVVLTPLLALGEGEYIFEPNLAIDFTFKWTSSNEEVFEEVVRLKDQSELKRLLDVYGAASFRPVGAKGPSFMRLEDIEPDKVYNLVHAGRRSHVLEVNHALDTLGKGDEDKTGEALLKVFGREEGVVDAYLLPSMRQFKVEKHEPHYGEEEASQEWDAAAVIKRKQDTELLLADHKRRLKASDLRKMHVRVQRAVERSKDPQAWRAYSGIAAYDSVRAVCSTKYIAPSEKPKVESASQAHNIPILLENGTGLSIGSALLNLEGD